MIDCGEGTQAQLRRSRQKFSRLNHIFISHLHGDHCFGLIGLLSTFGMFGRTATMHVYSPGGLEDLLQPQIDFFCKGMDYAVRFHPFSTQESTLIYDDRSVSITTIPLQHRIPCCGFLFAEKQTPNHIIRDMIDFYHIPTYAINRIKSGEDYTLPDGTVVLNQRLTRPSNPPRKYAYCSDTIYTPSIIPQIRGIDLLYHEATFADSELSRAQATFHTTASQAAHLAKQAGVKQLMIGHFSARYDNEDVLLKEAQGIFTDTIAARENLCITL